jgi:hypothetical protein
MSPTSSGWYTAVSQFGLSCGAAAPGLWDGKRYTCDPLLNCVCEATTGVGWAFRPGQLISWLGRLVGPLADVSYCRCGQASY